MSGAARIAHPSEPLLERVMRTLGCQVVAGSCRTHQRAMDKRRTGCPVADEIIRRAGAER